MASITASSDPYSRRHIVALINFAEVIPQAAGSYPT